MFPNEATYLRDWTGTSALSYGDFLRAKQFERSIRFGIDNQTKELIASNERLSQMGFEVISTDLERGFSVLSEDLNDIREAIGGRSAESLIPKVLTEPVKALADASATATSQH